MLDLIKAIWPFVSEMFFGGKSLKEVILANKLLSVLILLLVLSLCLNYLSLGKIYDMAIARREESARQATSKPVTGKQNQVTEPLPPNKAASGAVSSAASTATLPADPASVNAQEENRKKLKDVFKD